MNHRFVMTGGPGSGKTTILTSLSELGHRIAPESARKIIRERLAAGLSPRPAPAIFVHEILHADIEKYRGATASDVPMFFDRGILDALFMLDIEGGMTRGETARYIHDFPYNKTVLLLPPWKEIYGTDAERDQTFEQSVEVFEGMQRWYQQWGYETLEVPHGTVAERVSFILSSVGSL